MLHDSPAAAKILLVDDKPANLVAMRAILAPLGQDLIDASSGRAALELLNEGPFAAILLDVQMPEMDGIETAIRIKQREETRHVPILFLTAAFRDEIDVFKGYSVGAVDYIVKPVDPAILRAKVTVFLEIHRRQVRTRRQAELLREMRDREIADLRRASEQRYRDLADSMPQIVWTAADSGVVLYRNRRWYDCAGAVDPTREPLDWEAVLHPEDLAPFMERWETGLRTGEGWEGEFRFGSRATGVYSWHLVRVVHTTDAQGRGSWIGTSTDIDARKRAEQALRLRVDEAQLASANRGKVELLAALSQQLRAPLNVILGWADFARRGVDEPTLARALETIQRSARTQAQIIADLLDASQIMAGTLALRLRPVRLRTAVEDAVEAALPAATAAGIALEPEYALGDEEVDGDAARLEQIVSSLLSHAIKVTPPGGRVRVVLDRDQERARVVVEDGGSAIDPALPSSVFDGLRQGDAPVSGVRGAPGLGLAVVQHLVEAHGGTIEAARDGAGRGGRFTVRLSFAQTHSGLVTIQGRLAEVDEAAEGALSGLRLLIVEDDDDGREMIEHVLRGSGADVTAVSSAEAALDALRGGSFDVLVSDIGLPMMDGYALAERARASNGERLPAIALTAFVSRDDRERARAAGFEAHIPKPVEPSVLVTAVAAAAHSSRPLLARTGSAP